MGKKQTRRTLSVSGATYARMKEFAERPGASVTAIARIAELAIAQWLDKHEEDHILEFSVVRDQIVALVDELDPAYREF